MTSVDSGHGRARIIARGCVLLAATVLVLPVGLFLLARDTHLPPRLRSTLLVAGLVGAVLFGLWLVLLGPGLKMQSRH